MSVIVKGMEMPKNCFECPCCRHDSVDGIKAEQCNLTLDVFDANYFERWNSRAQNCPLIELPFAEELAEKLYKQIEKAVIEGSET